MVSSTLKGLGGPRRNAAIVTKPAGCRRLLRRMLSLAALVQVTLPAALSQTPVSKSGAEAPLTFEQHVRPILKAHCFDCHGEGDRLRGGLDLRLTRFLLRGGESGPAVVPGNPAASLVYTMVQSGKMPKRDRKPTEAEVETLRRWIAEGARTARPEPETLAVGMQITAEERAHWAFQPIRLPDVPRATTATRPRSPIDAFLSARLATNGLSFAPEAPRRTLIRRAYFDLWGFPPSPAETAEFLADAAPDAYERLIDRLLASPRYGERWGRHWLDIAGYADSDGYTNDDFPRPFAYKYRDYVIRALNEDRPLNRFILEQLAGDELALQQTNTLAAAALDPRLRDLVIATGFLRMAADGTASGGIDQDTARNHVIADTLKIVSTSLLGLSVGCAQCHDHRYDPIPQADYYRLRAVFEPAYDWKRWRRPNERLLSLYTASDRQRAADVETEAAALAREKETLQTQYIEEALKKHLEKLDPGVREAVWTAFKTPAGKRTPEQKKVLKDNPSANINAGVLYQYNAKAADELKAMDARIAGIRAKRPPEDFVSALWDQPAPLPVTHRFHRGDPKQPQEAIAPGTLSVLAAEGSAPVLTVATNTSGGSGRRLAFGHWLTSTNNPLVARVLVNRVWLHHFGRGLVETPADFGLQSERPSHPELLDWLAATFAAPRGTDSSSPGLNWSLKGLHRLILTSAAYRQNSRRREDGDRVDPENRLYWRRSLQRLDAEAIRDSFLTVAGVIQHRMYGKAVPVREDAVGQIVVGVDRKAGDNKMPVDVPMGAEEFRRGVYVEMRRSQPLAFLHAFDAPVMEVNCERRTSSTVAPQSLMLMNSEFALQQAGWFARRLRTDAGTNRTERVKLAWELAFSRPPTAAETDAALTLVTTQTASLTAAKTATQKDAAKSSNDSPEELAWRSLCQALLGANEFLYVD